MIKLKDLLNEDIGQVWVVYLRQTPRMNWQLNLIERDRQRAFALAKKWKQEMIAHGEKNNKSWNVQAAVDQVEDVGGDVARYEKERKLSPNAKLV